MRKAIPFLLFGAMVLVGGCSTKKNSPEFEKKFAEAKKKSGLKEVQIIDTKKSGDLKGNVQRLGDPSPPSTADTARKIPIKLSQNQVGRYIRRQLARLTGCHRAASGKSGKAMLTVKIMPSGRVSSVAVEAPSFSGTKMSKCLQQGAMRWKFPRFRQGPLEYTYPFIFR